MVLDSISMDLLGREQTKWIEVIQGDVNSRRLKITLFTGKTAWHAPEDTAVLIRYRKDSGIWGEYDTMPDGSTAWEMAGNVLILSIAPQVISTPGPVQMSVLFLKNEAVLNSFSVEIRVRKNIKGPDSGHVNEAEAYRCVTGFLPAPDAAQEGQILQIAAVDARGKVREVTAVDMPKGSGENGSGGYYTPVISQTDANTMQVSFAPSQSEMPAVPEKAVMLPAGKDGISPHIGSNGNWYLGEVDTGVKAEGSEGPRGPQGGTGPAGADGKSAYEYAQNGGYTGTEAEFAAMLAQEPLIGSTSDITPAQVAEALLAGRGITLTYNDAIYGAIHFSGFMMVPAMGVVASSGVQTLTSSMIMRFSLAGHISEGVWYFDYGQIASIEDIPEPGSVNIAPLVFNGAVSKTYDGSSRVSVHIARSNGIYIYNSNVPPDSEGWYSGETITTGTDVTLQIYDLLLDREGNLYTIYGLGSNNRFKRDFLLSIKDSSSKSAVNERGISDYVRTEAETVARLVNKHQSDSSIVFPFLTDAHCGYYMDTEDAAAALAGELLHLIGKRVAYDFIVHGGDLSTGAWNTTRDNTFEQVEDYCELVSEGGRGIPAVWMVGNHDDAPYMTTADRVTQKETFSLIGRRNRVNGAFCPDGCNYGYLDLENRKLRVIYLDTDDKRSWGTVAVGAGEEEPAYLNAHNLSGTQLQWLASTALDFSDKENAAQWGIIVVSHVALNITGSIADAVSGTVYNHSTENAAVILNAYKKGMNGSITHDNTTVSYDFSAAAGHAVVLCAIHGHDHRFCSETLSGNILSIGCPNVMNGRERASDDGNVYTKTAGTAEGTSFCILTIDRENSMVYADCVGAGYDRAFPFTA